MCQILFFKVKVLNDHFREGNSTTASQDIRLRTFSLQFSFLEALLIKGHLLC